MLSIQYDSTYLFEFYGEFENVSLYDGVFDPTTLRLAFSKFYLQGELNSKKYTLLEKKDNCVRVVTKLKDIILFKQDMRFLIS